MKKKLLKCLCLSNLFLTLCIQIEKIYLQYSNLSRYSNKIAPKRTSSLKIFVPYICFLFCVYELKKYIGAQYGCNFRWSKLLKYFHKFPRKKELLKSLCLSNLFLTLCIQTEKIYLQTLRLET